MPTPKQVKWLPDPITFALMALLVTGGAIISGMAGFGFGISIMPFLVLIYPPKLAVPMVMVLVTVGVIIQYLRIRTHTDYGLVLRMAIGMVVAMPLGTYVLQVISQTALKGMIGLAVLVAAVLSLVRRDEADLPPRRPGLGVSLGGGFLGGLLSTTVAQPGIPIAFLISWSRLPKEVARATIVTFFVLNDVASVASFAISGALTRDVLLTGAALFPFYLLGYFMGDRSFYRVSQIAYRRLVLGVLVAAAIMGVVNGVTALLV